MLNHFHVRRTYVVLVGAAAWRRRRRVHAAPAARARGVVVINAGSWQLSFDAPCRAKSVVVDTRRVPLSVEQPDISPLGHLPLGQILNILDEKKRLFVVSTNFKHF